MMSDEALALLLSDLGPGSDGEGYTVMQAAHGRVLRRGREGWEADGAWPPLACEHARRARVLARAAQVRFRVFAHARRVMYAPSGRLYEWQVMLVTADDGVLWVRGVFPVVPSDGAGVSAQARAPHVVSLVGEVERARWSSTPSRLRDQWSRTLGETQGLTPLAPLLMPALSAYDVVAQRESLRHGARDRARTPLRTLLFPEGRMP